jgi:hypothetical protein
MERIMDILRIPRGVCGGRTKELLEKNLIYSTASDDKFAVVEDE